MGRKKGVPNRITRELKDMILGALDEAGGQAYLKDQAERNPGPFLTLVGKVLPMTIQGPAENGAHNITIEVRGVKPPGGS